MRATLRVVAVLTLASCSGAPSDGEPVEDAGVRRDAGAPFDAGAHFDAGAPFDAGVPRDAGRLADAGSPADGGAPNDAGALPGGSGDSGVRSDAGDPTDAGTEPDGGSVVTWCTGRAEDFCEDFDLPAFTATEWSFTAADGMIGAGLPPGGLVTDQHVSAPNAFASSAPATSVGATLIQIQKSTGSSSSPNHVDADFAFSVRVASLCGGSRMEIARIEGLNPINFQSYGLALIVSSSGTAIELIQASKARVSIPLATALVVGTWVRVVIHLGMERVVTAPPTTGTIAVGSGAPESFSIDQGMGVRPNFKLGLNVTAPSTACEVDYDDVIYDVP